MDAVAILGCVFGFMALGLSIYNLILTKIELAVRRPMTETPTDTLDKARVLYPGTPIDLDEAVDDFDSPWNKEPQDEMEELLR